MEQARHAVRVDTWRCENVKYILSTIEKVVGNGKVLVIGQAACSGAGVVGQVSINFHLTFN